MAFIPIERTSCLDSAINIDRLSGAMFTQENEAHQFVITCTQNNVQLTLTGAITAKVVLANGNTVELVGTIDGGKAVVTLTQPCYNTAGRIQISIFNTVGSTKLCIYAAIAYVQTAEHGDLIDGSQIIDSAEDLIADIQAAVATIPPDYSTLSNQVADLKSAIVNLQDLYLAFDVDIQSRDTYRHEIDLAPGMTFTVTNGCSNGLSVWTMDENETTVDGFSAIPAGATRDITIAHSAVCLGFYSQGTGIVSVTDNSRIVPVLSERVDTNDAEIAELNAFKTHNPETNLIDTAKCASGYINGAVDGGVVSNATMYHTDYIPVVAGASYYFNNNYVYIGYYAFYDATKTYITGLGQSSGSNRLYSPFIAPDNAAYARFTILSQAALTNAWICETNQMAVKPPVYADMIVGDTIERPTDYAGNEISVFNKILCVGDSLTDGFFNENNGSRLVMRNRAFPAKLQALTGVECVNMGESGMTTAQWFTTHGNDDLSGYDACIIQLGVNDQLQGVSEADMDAALTSIISKLKSDNAGIKVFVATIVPGNGYMTVAMRTRSEMIRTYVNGLSDADVYLVDLWTYGHTDDLLAYDAGHLSALGYLRLAEDYRAYISYIIRHSPDDFRYVQFIGTSYSYNGDTQTRTITY